MGTSYTVKISIKCYSHCLKNIIFSSIKNYSHHNCSFPLHLQVQSQEHEILQISWKNVSEHKWEVDQTNMAMYSCNTKIKRITYVGQIFI